MADVTHVALHDGYVVLDGEFAVAITNMMDEDGDDTDDPDVAVVCVAGDDYYGWYTINLRAIGEWEVLRTH
jgi:hypothetical protein